MIRKAHKADVTDIGPRSIRVICSSENVDMMGDVVVQAGADLSVFKNNPIVLFSHNPEHAIGTASNVHIEDGCLVAEIEFAPEGLSKKADEICALVKAGILKSVSIGFDPIEAEPLNPSRPRGPQKYLKWTLCEISVVAIPANNDAIVTAKALETEAKMAKPVGKLNIKSLYDVGCLAEIMDYLDWQHEKACWEKACEGDDSAVPAQIAEVLHALGETLIAMTQEEVAECLAGTDARNSDEGDETIIVTMSNETRVKKLMAGRNVVKAGRAVSKATAEKLQDAMDTHAAVQTAQKLHDKCMKDMGEAMDSLTPTETKSAATPGVDASNYKPLVTDALDSHQMLSGALKMHAKCMKSLGEMVPGSSGDPEDNSTVTQSDGTTGTEGNTAKSKGVDSILTLEQRMQRVRLLAVCPA